MNTFCCVSVENRSFSRQLLNALMSRGEGDLSFAHRLVWQLVKAQGRIFSGEFARNGLPWSDILAEAESISLWFWIPWNWPRFRHGGRGVGVVERSRRRIACYFSIAGLRYCDRN